MTFTDLIILFAVMLTAALLVGGVLASYLHHLNYRAHGHRWHALPHGRCGFPALGPRR